MPKKASDKSTTSGHHPAAPEVPKVRKGVVYHLVTKPGRVFLQASDTGELLEFPSVEEARKAMR